MSDKMFSSTQQIVTSLETAPVSEWVPHPYPATAADVQLGYDGKGNLVGIRVPGSVSRRAMPAVKEEGLAPPDHASYSDALAAYGITENQAHALCLIGNRSLIGFELGKELRAAQALVLKGLKGGPADALVVNTPSKLWNDGRFEATPRGRAIAAELRRLLPPPVPSTDCGV